LKLKRIKPILVKYRWQNEFKLVWMVFLVILLCLSVTMYTAYSLSEARHQDQDEQIGRLYKLVIQAVILMNDTDNRLEVVINDVGSLKDMHVTIETKHGYMIEHGLIDKEEK